MMTRNNYLTSFDVSCLEKQFGRTRDFRLRALTFKTKRMFVLLHFRWQMNEAQIVIYP